MASSRGVLTLTRIYVVLCVSGLGDCANELQREEEVGMQRTGGEKEQSKRLVLAYEKDGANERMLTEARSFSMTLHGADSMANYGKIKQKREKVRQEKEQSFHQLLPNQNDDCDTRPNKHMVTEISLFWVPVEEASIREMYRKFKHKDEEDDDDEDKDKDKDKKKKKKKRGRKKAKEKKIRREEKKQRKSRPLVVEIHLIVFPILSYIVFTLFKGSF